VASATSDEVVFTLEQQDGSGGFPGNRSLKVRWGLDGDTLSLDISATTDRPTFINPAFHPFFIIPEGSRVMVRSNEIVEIGEGKIPTGVIADVEGTPYDLRQAVTPPDIIDHCYLIDGDLDEPCAVVDAPDHVLRVSTDAPGLQVFTGKPGLIAIEPEIHPDAPNHPDFPDIILRPGETFRQSSRWQVSPR
jgi:aldose 1-epimerase